MGKRKLNPSSKVVEQVEEEKEGASVSKSKADKKKNGVELKKV